MRGALSHSYIVIAMPRIIPADAGSTTTTTRGTATCADHPRGCGEHVPITYMANCEIGSSPRMRGALVSHYCCILLLRIIPADAGSTDTSNVTRSRRMGSSPRMRGARYRYHAMMRGNGIIPADAGSTLRNPCNPNNIIDKISNF